jgi:hypothetical protein
VLLLSQAITCYEQLDNVCCVMKVCVCGGGASGSSATLMMAG